MPTAGNSRTRIWWKTCNVGRCSAYRRRCLCLALGRVVVTVVCSQIDSFAMLALAVGALRAHVWCSCAARLCRRTCHGGKEKSKVILRKQTKRRRTRRTRLMKHKSCRVPAKIASSPRVLTSFLPPLKVKKMQSDFQSGQIIRSTLRSHVFTNDQRIRNQFPMFGARFLQI